MALIVLTLGIGATTAIFSVVDGVVLRGLPFPRADRLVAVDETNPSGKGLGGGHNLQEDVPAEVLAEVRQFLK